MSHHQAAQFCVALLWTGYASGLELKVALARTSQHKQSGDSLLTSVQMTLLDDFNLTLAPELSI